MSETPSRRDLLGKLGPQAAQARARRVWAQSNAPHRPPGALSEEAFLEHCNSCGACVEACPFGSIFVIRSTDVADGTPVMALDERPCHLCAERWCVAACEPGALSAQGPTAWGVVEVDPAHCFTFRGPECGACGGLCPTPTKALSFRRNRPQIDPALCIGCGLCIEACPTTPLALRFVSRSVEGVLDA